MFDHSKTIILDKLDDVSIDRDKYIGGSDIPTILGMNRFKTRKELLYEKALINVSEFTSNMYTEYGHKMEPIIREHISNLVNQDFTEYQAINDYFRFNDDGVSKDYVLEVKTTSYIKNDVKEYQTYMVQLLLGMHLHQKKNGILAVYKRPEDFNTSFYKSNLQVFKIKISDYKNIIDNILKECDLFYKELKVLKLSK